MIGEFNNIKIQGISAAVPKYVEDNMIFENILGTRRTKKQIQLTGISKRHIAEPFQRTSDLCYTAAVRLLNKLNWEKSDITVLIMVTQTPNYTIPSTAFFLHKRLGLSKNCFAFDINLGCSSFNAGVHVVSSLLQTCDFGAKALLLIGDTSGTMWNPDSKFEPDIIADRMLFGSAGAAIAIEKVKNHSIKFLNKSDGNGYDAIICHPGGNTQMNGEQVFDFAINDVADDVNYFRSFYGLKESDIDYYIFHQAQRFILDNMIDICHISSEKELRSLSEYGNTSGTSVPVSLCANIDRFHDQSMIKLFFCGFGIGLSWGIIYTEIPVENILPIIETDEHYDEDKQQNKGLKDKIVLVYDADQDLGESIARSLMDKSATVILAGKDSNRLNLICDDFYDKSNRIIVCSQDSVSSEISLLCEQNELKLDGIIFPDSVIDQEQIRCDFSEYLQNDIISDMCSIVLLSEIEDYYIKKQIEEYTLRKERLQRFVNELDAIQYDKKFRVNAILYAPSMVNLVIPTGNKQAWMRKFLSEQCPEEMLRPVYINYSIHNLLGRNSTYTSGNLISIRL